MFTQFVLHLLVQLQARNFGGADLVRDFEPADKGLGRLIFVAVLVDSDVGGPRVRPGLALRGEVEESDL